MTRQEIRVLTPLGMLGYGFPVNWFKKGLEMNPDIITADAGSTDSGPQKLGLGSMTCSKDAYYTDIAVLLEACHEKKVPLYISSAGGNGTNKHVDDFLSIIKDIASAKGYHFNMAAIYADIDKNYIKNKMKEGKVTPCGAVEPITEQEVEEATVVVAQMGVEPYLEALLERDNLDIIVSGRTYDPVPIAALGIKEGFDPGLCWHMGKIMECGGKCAEPAVRSIFGILRGDHFILEPLDPESACKTHSVASHTLYEKSHPYLLPGPGGMLDLSQTRFEQLTSRSVKVSGSKFIPSPVYTVKLEGAKKVGYRSICVAGIRDPFLIKQIEVMLKEIETSIKESYAQMGQDYQLIFHVYGKNGVMGELEPVKDVTPLELCVIIETAAQTQEIATSICSRARVLMLHNHYEGKIATSGNIALPFTPLEIPLGEVCKFNIYHLMEVDSPTELFPIKFLEV